MLSILLLALVTSFVLGMRHATDPDHVVAVTTIAAAERSLARAAVVGVLWGVGHTLTIIVVGGAIVLLKLAFTPRVGLSMELAVAVMLIVLGVLNLFDVRVSRPHPFAAARALAVGVVHGLAGSAAATLLVLPLIPDPRWAAVYLLVFGAGTIAGMALMTAVIAAPSVYAAARVSRLQRGIRISSGALSVGFGLYLAHRIGFVDGLLHGHAALDTGMSGPGAAVMEPVEPAAAREFGRRLRAWYRANSRDLPWRRTRDPYHVLVSELMLQQTQVSRVVPKYHEFIGRYPTLHDVARASPAMVMEAWSGLGYYARARNLHKLAAALTAPGAAGTLPPDPAALRALPGIGAYTAGAVASFAYERRAALVDTNVARVIRRVFLPDVDAKSGRGVRAIWAAAEQLLPRRGRDAWTHNQALMELGALVCTARGRHCAACPVRRVCLTNQRLGCPEAARRRSQRAAAGALAGD